MDFIEAPAIFEQVDHAGGGRTGGGGRLRCRTYSGASRYSYHARLSAPSNPIAKGHLERQGINRRVELVADFLRDCSSLDARSFYCVFLSHVLHDFEASVVWTILARAAILARPGGKLVIRDVFVPDEGHSNPAEALFDVMMLVEVSLRTHSSPV